MRAGDNLRPVSLRRGPPAGFPPRETEGKLTQTVRLIRDAAEHPDSHEANVRPEDVSEWIARGWSLQGADPRDHRTINDRPHLTPKQIKALDRIDDGVLKPGGAPKGGNRKRKA